MNEAHRDYLFEETHLESLRDIMQVAMMKSEVLTSHNPPVDETTYREAAEVADRLIEVHKEGLIRVATDNDVWTLFAGAELLAHRISYDPEGAKKLADHEMSLEYLKDCLAKFMGQSSHLLEPRAEIKLTLPDHP